STLDVKARLEDGRGLARSGDSPSETAVLPQVLDGHRADRRSTSLHDESIVPRDAVATTNRNPHEIAFGASDLAVDRRASGSGVRARNDDRGWRLLGERIASRGRFGAFLRRVRRRGAPGRD